MKNKPPDPSFPDPFSEPMPPEDYYRPYTGKPETYHITVTGSAEKMTLVYALSRIPGVIEVKVED